jgi:hypothetical protein
VRAQDGALQALKQHTRLFMAYPMEVLHEYSLMERLRIVEAMRLRLSKMEQASADLLQEITELIEADIARSFIEANKAGCCVIEDKPSD